MANLSERYPDSGFLSHRTGSSSESAFRVGKFSRRVDTVGYITSQGLYTLRAKLNIEYRSPFSGCVWHTYIHTYPSIVDDLLA